MTPPTEAGKALTVVVCGAGPATDIRKIIELAYARGWSVSIVATPAAIPFIEIDEIEALTNTSVRVDYRQPDQIRAPRTVATVQAVIVAPATYNTVCKLATGIADTYALGLIAEAIGASTRVVILPFVNTALANRAPFIRAVESLRQEGVIVLVGPPGWTPHRPGTGSQVGDAFPWSAALDAAESSEPF
jgi:phosphopantothenoylcysteine synthetase/decarboxylase